MPAARRISPLTGHADQPAAMEQKRVPTSRMAAARPRTAWQGAPSSSPSAGAPPASSSASCSAALCSISAHSAAAAAPAASGQPDLASARSACSPPASATPTCHTRDDAQPQPHPTLLCFS